MARMLGRNRRFPCPAADCTRCRSCGDGNETRAFKRQEQRELARELAPETDLEWLASLEPTLYDLSDCRHGCNGWPCGSEQCTFVCHEGLPVRTDFEGRLSVPMLARAASPTLTVHPVRPVIDLQDGPKHRQMDAQRGSTG